MRFTWTGLLLAPLVVPLVLSIALMGLFGAGNPAVVFLIILIPGFVVSYGTMIFVFLPCMFLISRCRAMTGFTVCLLGAVLGSAMFLPLTWMAWSASGPDSGPPVESFLAFLPRWAADPMTAVYPVAGLVTAGLYWWLGTRRLRASRNDR
jgi:hypothetical protein